MMDRSKPPHFGDVDQSPSPARFVHYMDASYRSESEKERELMRAPLRLSTGHRVLDVGCGPGNELLGLTNVVGETGVIIGVDNSLHMVSAARSRCSGPVSVVATDAHALTFASRSFDASRVERVLQHVRDPMTVLQEMVRVTRGGGRVLAVEPDWATLLIDSPFEAVTHSIASHKAHERVRNGWIGRQLRRMFLELDLQEVDVHFLIGRHEEFAHSDKLLHLTLAAEACVEEGVITLEEKTAWLEDLKAASDRGTYFASVTRVLVAGQVTQ